MSNELAVLSSGHITELAQQIAGARILGVKSVEEATGLIILALASGLSPYTAARDYHVINGRPTLKADAMLARFQQSGGRVDWKTYTDEQVTGIFVHPAGGSLEITWTIEQAKRAGLTGKEVWKQYPRAMLRSRVISEGIRTVYPAVAIGVYTPEEVQDFDSRPAAAPAVQLVDSAPAHAVKALEEPRPIVNGQIKALAATLREAGFGSTEEGKAQGRAFLAYLAGIDELESVKDLTFDQAHKVLHRLADPAAGSEYRASPQLVEAALSAWYNAQAGGPPDDIELPAKAVAV